MKVFKFGGASVKNSSAIRNMCEIIRSYQNEKLVVIVSAMGKSTNTLEGLINLSMKGLDYQFELSEFIKYHNDIFKDLLNDAHKKWIHNIDNYFDELRSLLEDKRNGSNYSQYYDKVVSYGELLSTTIISSYLNITGCSNKFLDARKLIKTDSTFQDGKVDWEETKSIIKSTIELDKDRLFITQGFIGSNSKGETTTLGREGSDYTAAIFASCLDAESVTIWKDVPGILNADPKIIKDAVLFSELPYNEASEMTYYGAKVIHPKTIKPLANKSIPLHVRCFDTPDKEGTIIHNCELEQILPVIIYKENQCLLSFKSKDLAFVNEKGLSIIFEALHNLDIVINIMQNSAISFSVCIDFNEQKINKLIEVLHDQFSILYNTCLQLVTIKNYNKETLDKYKPEGQFLLEQVSRSNFRVLIHQ